MNYNKIFTYLKLGLIAFILMWLLDTFFNKWIPGGAQINSGFPIAYYSETIKLDFDQDGNTRGEVLVNQPELIFVNFLIFYSITIIAYHLLHR